MTKPNKVYDTTPNLNHFKSQLISTTYILYLSKFSNSFGQILYSTTQDKILTNLNHFKCLNLSQFLTDFIQTLDSKSYDQS